ncbi:MAG: helix-turn-helix transcriptional regulator [Ginsengibacter sp.]
MEKPYTFLVKTGLSPQSATKILTGKARIFRLDHIEIICGVLVCEPNDVLVWTSENGRNYPENHPLWKLKPQLSDNNWYETFTTMPLKQLKEVTQSILDNTKTNTEKK